MSPDEIKRDIQIDEEAGSLAALIASLCGPALMLLALWFLFGSSATAPVPEAQTPSILASDIDPSPRFDRMTDPPSTVIGGYAQNCNNCHGLVDLSPDGRQPLSQHANIRLNHGRNDRCLNCHDRENRNRLVDLQGNDLAYADVAQLCAQCHGPIFNDWSIGTHGKTIGYWDSKQGESRRLTCTECHDPHSPAYEPMRPLPGPNTLRMGKQGVEFATHMSEERNPLLRWRFDENNGGHNGVHEQDTTDGGRTDAVTSDQ